MWIWTVIYPVVNILLIIMHYHLSPPMYAWLEKAPVKTNAIDNAVPWSAPYTKTYAKGKTFNTDKAQVSNIDAAVITNNTI